MPSPSRLRRLLPRLILLALGGLLALATTELVLRATAREAHAFYVWWPNLERVLRVSPGVMPGVAGDAAFRANSKGLRADELVPEHDHRILAVGGSTTECLVIDQGDAWPQALQAHLNAEQDRHRVWVGNAGKSGLNTRDHLVQLRYLLPQVPDVDRVLLLVGVNDLALRLSRDEGYDARWREREGVESTLLGRSFQLMPLEHERRYRPYKRTALWRLASRVKNDLFPSNKVQEDAGRAIETWRAHRRGAAALRAELPDLTSALEEYRRNLADLVELCAEHGAEVLFVTQPSLWRADLPEELLGYLWCGGVGDFMDVPGQEYYTVGALAEGMAAYNRVLLETARELGVDAFDLAARLPRDLTVFYDDVHFNTEGSRRVARLLADHLLARPPFAPASAAGQR